MVILPREHIALLDHGKIKVENRKSLHLICGDFLFLFADDGPLAIASQYEPLPQQAFQPLVSRSLVRAAMMKSFM